jgi:hypothetical protein
MNISERIAALLGLVMNERLGGVGDFEDLFGFSVVSSCWIFGSYLRAKELMFHPPFGN